jgi:hypothetical protein
VGDGVTVGDADKQYHAGANSTDCFARNVNACAINTLDDAAHRS